MANGDEPDKSIGQSQEELQETASSNLEVAKDRLDQFRRVEKSFEGDGSNIPIPDSPRTAGLSFTPNTELSDVQDKLGDQTINLQTGNIQRRLADEQGPIETFTKETLKLAPEIPLTIGEYAGHILDAGSWNAAYHGAEATLKRMAGADAESVKQSLEDANFEDAGNAFTDLMKRGREAVDEGELLGIDFETFREDPGETWAPFDSAWWAQHGSDLIRSVAAFGAIAGAGGAATRGAVGLMSRAAGAGSIMRGAMQRLGQVMVSTELAQAEGMAESTQVYEQVKREAKQAHLDQGKTETEAERLATEAAGKAAATTAGITLGTIPALNYMSVLPAFRATSKLSTLSKAGLARESGDTISQWLTKVSNKGVPSQLPGQLTRYARESGFESVEELSNQLAQVEGTYRGQQIAGIADPSTIGERISEEVISSEGALAAALGAVGGGGQQALIRNVPLHQRTTDEGETETVSAATLQAEKRMQKFQAMKDAVKNRAKLFSQWQEELKNASKEGDEQRMRHAQEALLSTMMRKSFEGKSEKESTSLVESLSVGAEGQIEKLVQQIRDMDETEAEEKGFETDQDSPYHYEKLADEYLEEIDELRGAWDKYQNQYRYTQEEEAVNMPAKLFNIEAQIRSMGRQEGRIDEFLQNKKDEMEGLPEAAQGEELDMGEMAAGVTRAKMDALEFIATELAQNDQAISDFDSVQELKNEIDFEEVRKVYLNDVADRLNEQTPGGDISSVVSDPESWMGFMNSSLETDLVELMDVIQSSTQHFELWEQFSAENVEAESRTYRPGSSKDAENALKGEVRRQSLRQKQRLYREHLNFLESPSGRTSLMERIKEREAEVMEERINEIQDDISQLETVEEVEQYQEELSPNETKAVKDALETRRQELETQEREGPTDSESDTEPESSGQPEGRTAQAPGPNEERNIEDVVGDDQERTQQQTEDEPTGPSEPTETERVDTPDPGQEPDTAPEPTEPESEPGTPATPSEPEESGALSQIKAKAKEKENRLPSIMRKRLNNLIGELEAPDNSDPDAMSVEEWIRTSENIINNIQNEMEALAQNPEYDITVAEIEQIADQRRGRLLFDAENKVLQRETPSRLDENEGEPQNIGETQLEAREDITEPFTEGFQPKIENRSSAVNYRSRPFDKTENGEFIEISNERNSSFDKLVETPVVGEETRDIIYKVEDNITQGQQIDNDLIENAKIEVFAITENENEIRIGALPLPRNIDDTGTQPYDDDGNNNIEKQKRKVRKLRAKILSARAQSSDATLTGRITEKRTGHLSIKYTEESLGTTDPDPDFRNLDEAFSEDAFGDKEVQLYVLKDGRAHISNNAHREVQNDFTGKHSYTEGSVGVVLPTPRGKNMAIPLHVPRIGGIRGLTQVIVNHAEGQDGIIDDTSISTDVKERELSKYIFISSGSISQVFKNESSPEKVRVMKTKNGITIGRNNGGVVYTTDESFLRGSGRGVTARPVAGNEQAVQDLISEMHLNVNLDRVNRNQPMEPGKHDKGFLDQYGEDITYDDFLKQNLQTDILEVTTEDFGGDTKYIYFEQPTIMHEPTFEIKEKDTPRQQGASTREHREPINVSAQDPQTEVAAEDHIGSLTNAELETAYSDTLDAMNEAQAENNQPLYESLRSRVNQIRSEITSREGMNADSLPPLPDRASFPSPEGEGEGQQDTGLTSNLSRQEIDDLLSTLGSLKNAVDAGLPGVREMSRENLEDKGVSDETLEIYDQIEEDSETGEDIQDYIDQIEQEQTRFVQVESGTEYSSLSPSEKISVDRIAEINQKIEELDEKSTAGEQQSGEDLLARQESGESAAQARAGERANIEQQQSLFEEMRELAQELGITQGQATSITQEGQDIPPEFEERSVERTTEETGTPIEAEADPLTSIDQVLDHISEEEVAEAGLGFFLSELGDLLSVIGTENEQNYRQEIINPALESIRDVVTDPPSLLSNNEELLNRLRATYNEYSEGESIIEEEQEGETGAPIEESAQEFDPSNVDLSNMNDPQARQWWRESTMQEIASNFREIYENGNHNVESETGDTLLSHLRDDIFEDETWTYETMGGDILASRLEDQAQEMPKSTPSKSSGEVDPDIADGSAGRWGGEADLSAGFGYSQPTEIHSDVDLSQRNFEEIISELQSEGDLTITCRT